MARIALLLFRKFTVEPVLPEICSDRLDLLFTILIPHRRSSTFIDISKSPEGRHFCAGSKSLGFVVVFDLARVLGILTNLFLVRCNLILELAGCLARV